MEYPMMANDSSDPADPALTRAIAAHELLHSWFPFYMGTNEQRYGFMDEGLTVTFDYLINTRDYGEAWATALFQEVRSGNLAPPFPGAEIPIITPSDSLRGEIVDRNNYEKAALGFLALKELMGDELFKQSLHEFIDRWNGKHPLPWDMFNTFNDASGQNYNWFFSTNYLDLAVGEVQKTDGGYTIRVRNVGGMAMPFDVNIVYADDTKETFRQNPGIWKGSLQTATVAIDSSKELKSLTLEGGIFMDVSPENNTWVSP
jgi:aminopeptidase N